MTGARSLFVSEGGTVRPDAPPYIERRADEELFTALRDGQLCYVLDSRQKGKSSLMNRMTERLRDARIATAVIDLQRLGTNVDPESWYYGMLLLLGESLQIPDELIEAWNSTSDLSAFARWSRAVESVILPKFEKRVRGDQKLTDGGFIVTAAAERLVVFVDEVDIVRSLPFSADEFFHGIRDMYNRRSTDPRFNRITFCLLGVAKPSELVRDARVTPFNVGRRIDLADFTLKEAVTLSKLFVNAGLASQVEAADSLMERVIYWTNGHPHLTQQVCAALEKEGGSKTNQDVDRIVSALYFQPQSLNDEPNLQDVSRRVLEIPPDGMDKEAYLFVLSERLERLIRRGSLPAHDDDPILKTLRLAGLTRESAHSVKIRNRVYERVFNLSWLESNIPEIGIRTTQLRQRRRWMMRTLLVGVAATALASLAVWQQIDLNNTRSDLNAEKSTVRKQSNDLIQKLGEVNLTIEELNKERDFVAQLQSVLLENGIPLPAPEATTPPPSVVTPVVPQQARVLTGGQFPFTQTRKVVVDDLAPLSKAQLRIMRNEIYARHNLRFNARDLRDYFAKNLPGYKGSASVGQVRLSSIERTNVRIVETFEKTRSDNSKDKSQVPKAASTMEEPPKQDAERVRAPNRGEILVRICIASSCPARPNCPDTKLAVRKKADRQTVCPLHP